MTVPTITTTYLTAEDVAVMLHTNPRQIRLYANAGDLRGAKVGKRWLFTPEAVAEYVKSKENRGVAPHRRRRRRRSA